SALVDQSLVQQREEDGEARFGMLQVIHEYALERLAAQAAEAEALRRSHAAYSLALAERAEPTLTGPEQGVWLERLEREHDNLRAALTWALGTHLGAQFGAGEIAPNLETGLRLVAALHRFWFVRGHLREGRAWVDTLLAQEPTPAQDPGSGSVGMHETADVAGDAGKSAKLWARALLAGGTLAMWQGDIAAAEPWLTTAVARARAADDLLTVTRALLNLGTLALHQNDFARAGAYYEESLALAREIGDLRGVAVALNNLGNVAVYQDNLARAADLFAEGLALMRQQGGRNSIAGFLLNQGWVARKQGALSEAAARQCEALTLARELDDARLCVEVLEYLAATAGTAEQGARAARLLGAAAAVRETLGAPQPPQEQAEVEEAVASARAALGEAA
ncbi:MAG: tetratricopeptide repeat protein, partial [Chloroflexota bacterium]|nr:tetratricopeptide repeat protein [Chloroflexota bacterium]